MRKYLIFTILLTLAATAAVAEFKFKDLPDDHWASSAVYDLVKMGVTKGYPDGTFRGNQKISRYETAVFLSKLATVIEAENIVNDIAILQTEMAEVKKSTKSPLTGSYKADWLFGNILATEGASRGAVVNYRLKLTSQQKVGDGADVTINLDTMDLGYFSDGTTAAGDNLATQMIDIESNLPLNLSKLGWESPVNLKLTYGPGAVQHTADPTGILPSMVGIVYLRPDTGALLSTKLWGADVSGGYYAVDKTTAGKVEINKISSTLGYAFNGVPLVNKLEVEAKGDYLSAGMFSSTSRDMRATLAFSAPLGSKVKASGTVGLGGSNRQNMMVAGEVAIDDVLETGTVANIRVSKVGSEYLDTGTFAAAEFDMAGLDFFDRPLENATFNFGGEVKQKVSPDVTLIGKGDLRLSGDYQYASPKGRLTAQGGVSYAVAPNTALDAFYRIHQDKATSDTSDIAALGLLYNF